VNSLENPGESAESISGPQKTTYRGSQSVRWVAVVAWMGLIFFLSAQPRLPSLLPPGLPQIQDVFGHFTVYAVLVVLVWWALRGAGIRHPFLWALGVTVLYSFTDEFHQSFVPNRHPDVFDLATDFAGAVTALFIVRWLGVRRGHA
jgi:VanZ family protein